MLWTKLAELPLVVEACEYERPHAILAHESERITTHVRLSGAGTDRLGEDVGAPRRRPLAARSPASAAAHGRVDAGRLLQPDRHARVVARAAGVALNWAWPAETAAIPGNCWTRPKGWASAHAMPAPRRVLRSSTRHVGDPSGASEPLHALPRSSPPVRPRHARHALGATPRPRPRNRLRRASQRSSPARRR
jgi:hypothetical protein